MVDVCFFCNDNSIFIAANYRAMIDINLLIEMPVTFIEYANILEETQVRFMWHV